MQVLAYACGNMCVYVQIQGLVGCKYECGYMFANSSRDRQEMNPSTKMVENS
ncbi:hypothetical protein LguiA_010738 [Lonicera macranthoides]